MEALDRFFQNVVIFIIAFALASASAHADQPYLPTTIYGRVLDQGSVPAPGVDVSVVWTDANDNQQTSVTKTLTLEQATAIGDSSLKGTYLFNQGYVKAKSNTEIKIIINNVEFEKITSSPGSVVNIRDAILAPAGTQDGAGSPSTSSGSGTSGSGQPAGQSGQAYNQNYQGPGTTDTGTGQSTSQPSTQNTGADSSSSTSSSASSTDSSSSSSSSSSSGVQSSSSTQDYKGLTPIASEDSSTTYSGAKSNPTLPTSVHGQLVDDDGDPVIDEEIIAEWTDDFGMNHTTTTKTFSPKEAKALGDKTLQGYYNFNKGDIKAAANSTITVRRQNGTAIKEVVSSPGNAVDAKQSVYHPSVSREGRTISNRILGTLKGKIFENFADFGKNQKLGLLVFAFLFLLVLVVKKVKKPWQSNEAINTSLYKSLVVLRENKAKNLQKNSASVSKDSSLEEVLSLMVSENKNSVVVVSNKNPVGIIDESSFLTMMLANGGSADLKQLKARDVMKMPLIVEPNLPVSNCVKLMVKKEKNLVVSKNNSFIGLLTAADLLRYFNNFLASNQIESMDVPFVRTIIGKDKDVIMLSPELKVSDACNYMLKNNLDYCLVQGDTFGIVTMRDIIEEVYSTGPSFSGTKLKNIMKSPVISITPGTSIFEANSIMLGNNFRRLPVVSNKKVIGVLHQIDLLYSIHSYFGDLVRRQENTRSK